MSLYFFCGFFLLLLFLFFLNPTLDPEFPTAEGIQLPNSTTGQWAPAAMWLTGAEASGQHATRISKFGAYSGYSEAIYDGWVRTSQYVTVRDGTKIAVDILRPSKAGKVTDKPLPVLWTHNRYHRASFQDGKVQTEADRLDWLGAVIKHGYVAASVDTRGGGASFGTQQGWFSREEAHDSYDITEWLAAQPWCNGKVGMYGRSYRGVTQYFAASEVPPHLKAIFPEVASFEWYPFIYPGGVYRNNFIDRWNRLTKALDASIPVKFDWFILPMGGPVVPVDEDRNGKMLAEAIGIHKANRDMVELFSSLNYRNSLDKVTGTVMHLERSPWTYADGIEKSGVAIYHLGGWFDLFPRDTIFWFKNLHNPQKVVIGPWFHTESAGLDLAAEHLRWFDYWLKGINNGVMDEAPFHYWTLGAPKAQEWRSTWQWPLPNERPANYYFQSGPSRSIRSVNDGQLSPEAPTSGSGRDDYAVDYSTTSGQGNRWANGYGGKMGYPDMTPNDRKGLTYTTAPLPSDVEVTGHPVVHLWVTSTARDGDFFVYLEEVGPKGESHYVTEGTLRASHRAVSTPSYNFLGLPYHRSFAEDVADLPAEPVQLAFDLHPTSKIFKAGTRIRITITCADQDNTLTPVLSPPPTVSVYRDALHASSVTLPIIPAGSTGGE